MRTHRALLLSGILAACGLAHAQGAEEVAVKLDIQAQPIGEALNEFARQAGLQIILETPDAEGVTSAQLVGEYKPRAALEKLLANSGLQFEYLNENTVAVRRIAAAEKTSSNEDSTIVAEIIVTATKRAESIQGVPISITAIGNQEIERRGLKGMGDYLSSVPGVSYIETRASSNAIVIRGIETSPDTQNFGAGTTVATYFGETPITNSAGLLGGSGVDLKLVDIERVEVLRGPQGTSFGDSSLGGAVRTIPVAPVLTRFEGRGAASYSNTSGNGGDNTMYQAVLNVPLIDNRLAFRLVGYRYENSGYYRNVSGSNAQMQAYATLLGPQALALATDSDDRGADEQAGGRLAIAWQALDNLMVTLSHVRQTSEQEGFSSSQGLDDGYGYIRFRISPQHAIRGAVDHVYYNRVDISNLVLDYDVNWADVVASVSWTDSTTEFSNGSSYNSYYDNVTRSPYSALSAELRMASKLDGPVQFLAGVFHEKSDGQSVETYGTLIDPALNPRGNGVDDILGIYDNRRDLKQDALFGEIAYQLTEQLELVVGARHYRYERDNRLESQGWFVGTALGQSSVSDNDIDKSGENFKASLSYKPSDDAMVYASWSQGFRLGRPSAGLIDAVCDTNADGLVDGSNVTMASTREIDSDTLDNYELGGKFTFLDGRLVLNSSAYRIKWEGLPTNTRVTCGTTSYFYVANAGEATSTGAELQGSWQLSRGLRVDFGASYTEAELTADAPALNAFDGDRLPGSPKVVANLAMQLDFPLASYDAYARADGAYTGTFYGNLQQSPLTKSGGYVRANLRAGIRIQAVDAELFVNNLTNVDEFAWRGLTNTLAGFGYIPRPRTIGMQLGYRF
jgi:iron complex outermembrane recepter protein